MTNEPFMKKEREPLTRKQTIMAWVSVAVGILALSITAFFIAKAVTAPEPAITEPDDRLIQDDYEEEYDDTLKNIIKPGETVPEDGEADSIVGTDLETNYPIEGTVKLDSVKEVDPQNIGPLKLEAPLLGDYEARIWYITTTITVDKKPSDKTGIYFPASITNDRTPGDDTKGMVFSRQNPDCLWGPETWGEVEGNTATLCRVFVTFDNEPIDKTILVVTALDYDAYPEYGSNPPSFTFTAEPIENKE